MKKNLFEKYIKEDEKILLKDHALTDTKKYLSILIIIKIIIFLL